MPGRPRILFVLALLLAALPARSQEKKKFQHFALIYSHGPKWAEGSTL